MTIEIHRTAVVDPTAELGHDIAVGPYAVIGPRVTIGDRTHIGPHVVIEQNTRIGSACFVGAGSILGAAPQDRKFSGAATWLEVGDETIIREYVSLHRGTEARGVTRVGRRCFLMTYVHVAHDCEIEDDVTLANMVQLAGHVLVEAHAAIGGLSPVHQFVRIGTHAFIGGGSRVPQDVPPYTRAAGNPLRLYGINTVGLTRAGVPADVRLALKHAYRVLFNSERTLTEAVTWLRRENPTSAEVQRLLDFVERSQRGVLV